MKILITGGLGFVGSHLAHFFSDRGHKVTTFDNLRRRGSELNLSRLQSKGVVFVHGDVRSHWDLDALDQNFDVMIEASAEPSVHAGNQGSPRYVLDTNLNGALNCWEFARKHCGFTVFLSTSRVYSIDDLSKIDLKTLGNRFVPDPNKISPGFSSAGINENFSTKSARSIYGATKLAGEMFLQEYGETFGMQYVINRCGVIAGPGQFGKIDQGVYTMWVAHHVYNLPLSYIGFGGLGYQVRDLLHPQDLAELLALQIDKASIISGKYFNVGGGIKGSVSLVELSHFCQNISERKLEIKSKPETAKVDIPFYVSDCSKINQEIGWEAKISPKEIIEEIYVWIKDKKKELEPIFCN